MSWAKRNLYFLVSCIVAVGLLLAAGWYCYSSWASNNANWEQLNQDYTQLLQLATKPIGAGNGKVDNITTAREQTKEVKARVTEMEKLFTPVRGIPNTNHFDDRVLSSAVRDTVTQLRSGATAHNVTLPLDFAFSFTLQEGKAIYDPNSWDQLSRQLGEIKAICDTLYSCRVIALDAIQREHTADDVNATGGAMGTPTDYTDSISVTNNGIVITPYQITFDCFTPELGSVLSSFANQSHTFVVKTLDIQPQESAYGEPGMMMPQGGREPGGGYGNREPGGGYGNTPPPVAVPGRGLPTVIDEKKLKVIIVVDVVKMLPAQGR